MGYFPIAGPYLAFDTFSVYVIVIFPESSASFTVRSFPKVNKVELINCLTDNLSIFMMCFCFISLIVSFSTL